MTSLRIMVFAAFAVAVCALFFAVAPAPKAPSIHRATVVGSQQHPCSGSSYTMQCGAGAPGQILAISPNPTAVFVRPGVDFAWGGPSCEFLRSHGASFGASYLSDSSKDWSYGTVQDYRRHGCGVVFVWETSAARTLDGYSAGYRDAYNATHEAARLGFSHGHIDFASDFDSSPYGTRFLSYYQGARAWDNRAGFTTGGYGGLHTVEVLCANGFTANWQTLAWSYGVRASVKCAPLYQASINNIWFGRSVDHDIAYASYYGQSNAAKPKPKPPKCLARRWPHTKRCKRVRYGYSRTEAELHKVTHQLHVHQCSRRKHPRYCGGWRYVAHRDRNRVAAFRRVYA